MAFMVKNPGMIPTMDTLKKGEVGRRRDQMAQMFEGFWRACISKAWSHVELIFPLHEPRHLELFHAKVAMKALETAPTLTNLMVVYSTHFADLLIDATDQEKDVTNLKMMGDKSPFIADAIIANPPSFAHIHVSQIPFTKKAMFFFESPGARNDKSRRHSVWDFGSWDSSQTLWLPTPIQVFIKLIVGQCAERLGIPLHLMFTFPYTPTQAFPHPLANIKKTNVDPGYANFMSYPLVEMMTWQG
jgi:hypothetical protein